jgi:hypothetical protein
LLGQSIADLLKPACVIKHYKNFIVHFVYRQKWVIHGVPFFDLFVDDAIFANEVTHHGMAVVKPELTRLDVTVVVFFGVKHENVESFVRVLLLVLRFQSLSLEFDLVTNLSDISLQIVIVQTLASQAELCEATDRDLIKKL